MEGDARGRFPGSDTQLRRTCMRTKTVIRPRRLGTRLYSNKIRVIDYVPCSVLIGCPITRLMQSVEAERSKQQVK